MEAVIDAEAKEFVDHLNSLQPIERLIFVTVMKDRVARKITEDEMEARLISLLDRHRRGDVLTLGDLGIS